MLNCRAELLIRIDSKEIELCILGMTNPLIPLIKAREELGIVTGALRKEAEAALN